MNSQQPQTPEGDKKAVILSKHAGHYPDILADDLLNEYCVSPKACFAAMDDWGIEISKEFEKWKDYPFATRPKAEGDKVEGKQPVKEIDWTWEKNKPYPSDYDMEKICSVCGGRYGLHSHSQKRCPKNINDRPDHTDYGDTFFRPLASGEEKSQDELWEQVQTIIVENYPLDTYPSETILKLKKLFTIKNKP